MQSKVNCNGQRADKTTIFFKGNSKITRYSCGKIGHTSKKCQVKKKGSESANLALSVIGETPKDEEETKEVFKQEKMFKYSFWSQYKEYKSIVLQKEEKANIAHKVHLLDDFTIKNTNNFFKQKFNWIIIKGKVKNLISNIYPAFGTKRNLLKSNAPAPSQ